MIKESYWYQSNIGDNGESFGIGQVRTTAHPAAFQYAAVNARNSTAYNLDYTYAVWRDCFEGRLTWLNTVERGATYAAGDAKGCLGVWFAGRWYTQPAVDYIARFDQTLAARSWEQSWFGPVTTTSVTTTVAPARGVATSLA